MMLDVSSTCNASSVGDTRYEQRKLDGRCTRGSCKLMALDGLQLCAHHHAKERLRQAEAKRVMRATRTAAGMCGECGRYKTKRYRCAKCQLDYEKRASTPPRKSGTNSVTTATDDRIAAATRVDATGRTRYHGQMRRGAPTREAREGQDRQDLEWAIAEIRKSIESLGLLDLQVFASALRAERTAARRAALSQAGFAARLIDSVLDRNGYSEAATEMVPR